MAEFAANRVIKTEFLIIVVMTVFYIRILMNIHVLSQSPFQKEMFSTNITFLVLGFCVRFQVGFKMPTFFKIFVTKVTFNEFWMFCLYVNF